MIAFTDHNTVAGYRRMQEEIEQLELLEKLEAQSAGGERPPGGIPPPAEQDPGAAGF